MSLSAAAIAPHLLPNAGFMKFVPVLLALAALAGCASQKPVPPAPVAAPAAPVQPVFEPLPAGVTPLTVEQDQQISG